MRSDYAIYSSLFSYIDLGKRYQDGSSAAGDSPDCQCLAQIAVWRVPKALFALTCALQS